MLWHDRENRLGAFRRCLVRQACILYQVTSMFVNNNETSIVERITAVEGSRGIAVLAAMPVNMPIK